MTGKHVELFGLRTFDFEKVQSGLSLVLPVARRIDVTEFTVGAILVRSHSIAVPSGARLAVNIYEVLPSFEDPAVDFVRGLALSSFELTTAAPALTRATLNLVSAVAIDVELQGTAAGAGGPVAALSGAIALKE